MSIAEWLISIAAVASVIVLVTLVGRILIDEMRTRKFQKRVVSQQRAVSRPAPSTATRPSTGDTGKKHEGRPGWKRLGLVLLIIGAVGLIGWGAYWVFDWNSSPPAPPPAGHGFGFFNWLLVLAAVGIVLYLLRDAWREKWSGKKTDAAKADDKTEKKQGPSPMTSLQWVLPWVTVPFQHGAGIYWWWFGQAGYWRSVGEGVALRPPIFTVFVLVDRTEQDLTITTPQLPTGIIKVREIEREEPKGEGPADRGAAKLEKVRQRAVSGTLSYDLRMTATIRSGDGGIKTILRAKPAYRDFTSTELKGRFTDIISGRLRTALKDLPFEDAFFIPAMILLLGNVEELRGEAADAEGKELVGSKRWVRILADNPVFSTRLTDPEQVRSAIFREPDCLLRTLYDLGYKITFFDVKDPNPPEDLEKQLKQRVIEEIKRDAQYTKYISENVDRAEAESSGRNIQSRASVYDYEVNLEALEKAFKRAHPTKDFSPSFKDLLWLQNFREDRRTRRLMAGRVTVIDVGADSPIPAAFAPFFAGLASKQD